MADAAKAVVLLLVHCLVLLQFSVGVLCLVLVLLFSILCPSLLIILMEKRKLVALL